MLLGLFAPVSADFFAVSAQLHAAPAARSIFTGIEKMQDTLRVLALFNTAPVLFADQFGGVERDAGQDTRWVVGIDLPVECKLVPLLMNVPL